MLRFVTLLFSFLLVAAASADGAGRAKHVVLIVWDGMRPDLMNAKNTPALDALAHSGVFFKNNHAVYPSSTNVNGAVLATGVTPGHNGIVANQEFRPAIDPAKPFDTSDFPGLDGPDPSISAQLLAAPTIAEILQRAGHWTAVAGSKPVARFFDRAQSRTSAAAKKSTVIYRGKVLPKEAEAAITDALGLFPIEKAFPKSEENDWTTDALANVLWRDEVPKFSLLWLSEPDLTEHETSPGGPLAMAAIRDSDRNLSKVLTALKTKGALGSTDVFVVSDHGFSTVDRVFDVGAELRKAGLDAVRVFDRKPQRGQILVVSLGGSVAFYVVEHEQSVIDRLIEALQRSEYPGVILSREAQPGTFTFAQAGVDASAAPDVLVAARWRETPNEFAIPGAMYSDLGRSVGHGSHSTLSPHDMNNTLVASGPDFRRNWTDEIPSGNIDLAPTIHWILGVKSPYPMDGRILREAFIDSRDRPTTVENTLRAQRDLGGSVWRQHLRTAAVEGVTYLLEGNGGQTSSKP